MERLRRLRQSFGLRKMIQENHVHIDDLIQPFFVVPGQGIKKPIPSLVGNYHLSVDELIKEVHQVVSLGIPGILLFGLPEFKDAQGSGAWALDGPVQQAVAAVKNLYPQLLVITDVCLCQYTDHGHCGLVKEGIILNDPTLELLGKVALSHVQAGADIVAPSDMMDGRVGFIRHLLDEHGFTDKLIMSYGAKYSSAFYGPFRQAANSAPQFGDRRTYQLNPANAREALRQGAADVAQGADILMVKPGLPYLDIVYRFKETFTLPLAVYQVSGEYAMLKAAAQQGFLDGDAVLIESLIAFKRAGADLIITYFARDFASREG